MDEINDLPETMMCGIINHAMGIYELHVIPENHAHDASLTISILHNHIVRIKDGHTRAWVYPRCGYGRTLLHTPPGPGENF